MFSQTPTPLHQSWYTQAFPITIDHRPAHHHHCQHHHHHRHHHHHHHHQWICLQWCDGEHLRAFTGVAMQGTLLKGGLTHFHFFTLSVFAGFFFWDSRIGKGVEIPIWWPFARNFWESSLSREFGGKLKFDGFRQEPLRKFIGKCKRSGNRVDNIVENFSKEDEDEKHEDDHDDEWYCCKLCTLMQYWWWWWLVMVMVKIYRSRGSHRVDNIVENFAKTEEEEKKVIILELLLIY